MAPETVDLFRAVASADLVAVQQALAAGADVNAADYKGRNVVSHAALGDAIDAIHAPIQPRLSERRLEVLQLLLEHPDLTLYSLNAPLLWAGGVTLLGLMSWLNMPTEIMCLLEFTQGLVEVNAMDEQGATPLMYAVRDGNLEVVQRLLAHGARPEFRDASQRSTIQYALLHPQVLWLCEDNLRRERVREPEPFSPPSSTPSKNSINTPLTPLPYPNNDRHFLFVSSPMHTLLTPPPPAYFDATDLRRTFDALICAIRDGDLASLNSLLSPRLSSRDSPGQETGPKLSASPPMPLLVNLRDTSGLSLVHHAVSQRHGPRIAVLDALYRAGADVGLFSTLGFTPLHHLARTARDEPKPAKRERETSRPALAAHTHPLYAFTTHLVRELHAPLSATDGKGETPMHAAAEHGHSVSVLQAMLDCDQRFSGNEAVRSARNERGLRPVDVAKPEFLPLFVREQQSEVHPPSQTLPSDSPLRQNQMPSTPPATGLVRPSSVDVGLSKKDSSTSLESRSSGSSNSSLPQPLGSHLPNQIRSSQQPIPSRRPVTPLHTLPTPNPTPPGPNAVALPEVPNPDSDLYAPIDVEACALDVLSNLSLCASALHAYTQQHPFRYEMDVGSLPDLPMLSDTLLFTRDLASHVLEHWTARLQVARGDFERARRELEKAVGLRERVGKVVRKLAGVEERESEAKVTRKSGRRERTGSTVRQGGKRESAGFQSDSGDDTSSQLVPFPPRVDEVVSREAKTPRQTSYCETEQVTNDGSEELVEATSSLNTLQSAPRVLQRVESDLDGILAQVAQANHSFTRAQQSLQNARMLVEQAIKPREIKLNALVRIHHHQDITPTPTSSRLSPILERSPDPAPISAVSHSPSIEQISSSSPSNSHSNLHYLMAAPIEEPHDLRRFLTRRLARHVERVFDDLQKAHVWLRIIREVLRGLWRRVCTELNTEH